MRETDYAYAVAYIRTFENKMLSKQDMEALLSMNKVEESMKYLAEHGYGSTDTAEHAALEDILKNALESAWQTAIEACPDSEGLDILLYQNDFHNLKTILKSVALNADWRSMVINPCTVNPEDIYEAVIKGKIEELPLLLREAAIKGYDIIVKNNDGQLAEVIIDRYAFIKMMEKARKSKNDFLIKWVELNCAIANMKIAFRSVNRQKSKNFLEEAFIPNSMIDINDLLTATSDSFDAVIELVERSGFEKAAESVKISVSSFEKWCDDEMMKYMKSAKSKMFGIEPIFAFLYGKQTEIQSIRIILSGQMNNISSQEIRERLRELYA